jgi:hypothetical protein
MPENGVPGPLRSRRRARSARVDLGERASPTRGRAAPVGDLGFAILYDRLHGGRPGVRVVAWTTGACFAVCTVNRHRKMKNGHPVPARAAEGCASIDTAI